MGGGGGLHQALAQHKHRAEIYLVRRDRLYVKNNDHLARVKTTRLEPNRTEQGPASC